MVGMNLVVRTRWGKVIIKETENLIDIFLEDSTGTLKEVDKSSELVKYLTSEGFLD